MFPKVVNVYLCREEVMCNFFPIIGYALVHFPKFLQCICVSFIIRKSEKINFLRRQFWDYSNIIRENDASKTYHVTPEEKKKIHLVTSHCLWDKRQVP